MNTILELLKKQAVGLGITLGSLFLVFFLHRIHAFDTFELKVMDLAFKTRGPISGWAARDELPKDSLDVVLVDVDDESYRLVPWTWPYPRGVWGMVVRNLSKAGAKVIAFDIQFDAPDRQSEYLKEIRSNLQAQGLGELVPAHGDSVFAEAIREAQSNGTSVILASKLVQEPTRMPPQYIQFPNPVLQTANADYGLVNEAPDKDGFSRQYYTFLQLEQEPGDEDLAQTLKYKQAFEAQKEPSTDPRGGYTRARRLPHVSREYQNFISTNSQEDIKQKFEPLIQETKRLNQIDYDNYTKIREETDKLIAEDPDIQAVRKWYEENPVGWGEYFTDWRNFSYGLGKFSTSFGTIAASGFSGGAVLGTLGAVGGAAVAGPPGAAAGWSAGWTVGSTLTGVGAGFTLEAGNNFDTALREAEDLGLPPDQAIAAAADASFVYGVISGGLEAIV
ncbi:MAG: CHASE2 domain-containing protein, partial [Candidatus Marinimicrobia bacterium]|nr:CHASE2 domain-containing protein [Candidatus Neomarinimicrobiota bacterium]